MNPPDRIHTHLGLSPNTTIETPKRDNLLLIYDVPEVLQRFLQMHLLDSLSSLPCVLEVDPQVHPTGLAC